MKKSITLVLSLSVIYWSNVPLCAQGKGSGRGTPPAVSQGRHAGSQGPKTNSGKEAKPPSTGKQPKTTNWEAKFNQRLQSDPRLQTRIQGLLPAGMDPQAAGSGFKNHGQFIAALHVSTNLGIPFDQLKAKMTGIAPAPTTSGQPGSTTSTTTTTSSPMSLGKAIQELKPAMTESQANEAAKQAEKQAKETEKAGSQT